MIAVTCKEEKYIYNAYHITKAFFPDEDVKSAVDPAQREAVKIAGDSFQTAVCEHAVKDETDREIYRRLSEITHRQLPWGILTGVRPVKPAAKKLQEGMSREDFIKWYGKEKLVSPPKAGMAYDIAGIQERILHEINPSGKWTDTCSIYIGIPFCTSICSYCSFSLGLISDYKDRVGSYLDALEKELDYIAGPCWERRVMSIYIGGGTPTSLNEGELARLMDIVGSRFDTRQIKEFCLEAGRPDTINPEKLKILKAAGVNRISINPQTMQQRTLDLIGRDHSISDVYRAFEQAREAGFHNINMDLIAGLEGENARDMADTLERIFTLDPESLTVHALALKRRARQERQTGSASEVEEMIEAAALKAQSQGLSPYYLYRQKSIAGNFENTGYAKPGKEGLYNVLTMEEVQSIFAAGAGTDTKIVLEKSIPNPQRGGKAGNILRCSNAKDVEEYINRIDEMIQRKTELLNFSFDIIETPC